MNNEMHKYHFFFTETFIRNNWELVTANSKSSAQSAEELLNLIDEGSVFILGAKIIVEDALPDL